MKSQESAAAKKAMTKGKNSVMNGRALFSYNPELFKDAEGATDKIEFEEEEQKVDENLFAQEEVKEEDVDFD